MLTLIGVLLLFVSLVSFFWGKLKREKDEQDKLNNRNTQSMPSFPIPGKPLVYLLSGILFLTLNGVFFWANAGTAYAVQYPWGGDTMVKTQGVKLKWWGRTIPLSYEISLKDVIRNKNSDGEFIQLPENADGIYNRPAQRWEFSDAIKADIETAVVVGISVDDEEAFLNMADRNRSEAKLIYGRVLPNIDAALKNTCKLMDAQEYISGKASDFDRYFRDQLENGMYLVESYETNEEVPEIIGDTTTVRLIKPATSTNKQTKYRIKKDDQGNILRDNKSNTLKQYGIKIYQAQVTGIDWEESFDKRLDLQKDQVAQTQLEKQEAEKEFYRAKKEIASGEAEKAKERASLEKEQIKLTIAAETTAKVAEQNVIVERRQLEVEKLKAQSVKVAADATYYKNQKLVQAGLTPQERMKMDIQKNSDTWNAIGGMKFDGVYMLGGTQSKSSDGILSSLLGAEVAKGMKTTSTK